MAGTAVKRRAQRALERQLIYQQRKAGRIEGHEAETMAAMAAHSAEVRSKLERVQPLRRDIRVLEVGSGAHGLIFFFDAAERVGVDPLAEEYRRLFPAWQANAETIACGGEKLPFSDAVFDVVLCDNVVDHAEDPRRIVEEITRVLTPGGLLYFTVNVHHPLYEVAAKLHSAWRRMGVPLEITPFADHTVHLTIATAEALLAGLPLRIASESDTIAQTKDEGRTAPRRHPGDMLKRWFFKNARWEAIAVREDELAPASRAS